MHLRQSHSLDLGISTDAILAGLSAFGGADRRFQYKGCVDGVTIIDDYAHHPTEIRATLTMTKIIHTSAWSWLSSHTPIPGQKHF